MKCRKCNTSNKLFANYCSSCGAKLKLPFYLSWWFWIILFILSAWTNVYVFFVVFLIADLMVLFNIFYFLKFIITKAKASNSALPTDKKDPIEEIATENPIVSVEDIAPAVSEVPQETAATFEELHDIPIHIIEKSSYSFDPQPFKKIKSANVTVRTKLDKLGTFIAIDTETTGFHPPKSKIIELSAVKFENWIPTEIFETLINPQTNIPSAASAVNHITDDMVSGAPLISEVMADFNSFVEGFNIVGHNINYDLEFLNADGAVFDEKTKFYDTLWIAEKVLTSPKTKVWNNELKKEEYINIHDIDVQNYKLETLAKYYKIGDSSKAHRSSYDAYVTGLIFKELAYKKAQGKE